MPRKFSPKRIRNVRSSKATVRRAESMMGKGTNITGLDTESLRQRIDTIETPVKASSQAVGDALSGLIPPFQIDDSVIPATNYERSGTYYSPNFTGQETTYVEMQSDEMTRLPRKWRNLINTTLAKNPDNWTQTTAEIKATGTDGVFSVTGLTGGSTIVSFTSDGSEDIADREFLSVCYVKAQTAGQIGKQVNIQADRGSGGTYVSDTVVVTLTNEWQLVSTDAITGLASNLGFRFRVVGAASNVADGCLLKYPNIQEVTNLTNKNPSEPVWGDDSKRELITNGTFSSDPEIPYARVAGASGSGFTMPTVDASAWINPTFYARCALDDWGSGSQELLGLSQWEVTGNQRSWAFYKNAANRIALFVSTNGAYASDAANSPVGDDLSAILTNGTMYTFKCEYVNATGVATFSFSTDITTEPNKITRWASLGSDTATDTGQLFNSTALVTALATEDDLSDRNTAGKLVLGQVYQANDLVLEWDAANFNGNYYLDADHNMLTPAARHDIANEWTQTGTGSVTGASGNQELVNTMVAANWDAQGANTVSDVADGEVQVTYVDNGGGADFKFRFGAGLGAEFDSAPVIGDYYLITGQAKVNTGTVNIRMVGSTVESLAISSTSFVDFAFVSQCNSTTAFRIDMTGMGSGETINVRNISCKPFALDGRTGYGQNTVLNALKAPRRDFGSEEVVNGTFDADIAGWTDASGGGASISWDGVGALQFVVPAGTGRADQSIATTIGRTYAVSFTSSANMGVDVDSTGFSSTGDLFGGPSQASGSVITFTATTTTSYLRFSQGTNGVTLDNISVKEIIYDGKRFIEPDKNTEANALNPSRDANATTGWGTAGLGGGNDLTITTVETNNSSHAFYINGNANPSSANRVSKDLITDFGLVEGKVYQIEFDWKHKGGGGDWTFYLSSIEGGRTLEAATITNADTTYQTETILYVPDSATNSWGVFRENNGGNSGQIYVDNFSIKEVDPNYWFRNDGLPTQGANGKLELDRAGGGFNLLSRPLDLSRYNPGDVLTISLVTEAQSHDCSLYFVKADLTTQQTTFTATTTGRRVWYHVLTQNDIDNTAFLAVGPSGNVDATATVLDVSIRKFTGCFTVLDDQDNVNSNPRWIYDVTIPNNNQRYSALVTLSQGTAPVTTIRLAPTGVSEDKNRIDYVWATQTLTIVEDESGNTTASAKQNANGTVTFEISCQDIASNNAISLRLYPAALATSNRGSVNLHEVSLTGANWVPNGNIAMNTDDWEPSSDALVGLLGGEMYLVNTAASVSRAYQSFAVDAGREYVGSVDNTSAQTIRLKWGTAVNDTTYGDWGSIATGFLSDTISPTGSTVVVSVDSNASGLGAVRTIGNVSVQESSYGLGTSRYMNNALVLGDGTVTYDELHWLELDGTSGTYASTPDSAANSVTGDITLVAWAALDDWTPSTDQILISKSTATGNQRGFQFVVDSTTNDLQLVVSADGIANVTAEADALTGFADGTGHWLRASWDDSADEVTFYTSDQPAGTALSDLVWTQLGSTIALSSAGIYDSEAVVEVGSANAGTAGNASGKISRAYVIDSTDPTVTPVESFAAETAIADGWTINGSAQIKNNTLIPLHRYEDEQLHDDYAVVPVPGRYKHFTTSEAMEVGNARLPSLANANHPNGGGIYADVAALPNLIDPRARVNFATWTKSGSGYHSSKGIGDGTEIVTSWQAGTTAPDTLEIDGLDLRIVRSTTGTKHVVSQVIPITEGQFYKVRFNLRLNSGSLAAARIKTGTNTSLTTLQPLNEVMTEGLNEHFFWASETDTSARIGFSIASMCDFNISDFEFEEATYSYTQFSDLDTASYKARWENAWDVPADSQKYQVKVRVSKGSNRYQNVRVRVGSGLGERLVIDWQEGNIASITTAGSAVGAETIDWNLSAGQAIRGEVDVIATVTNDSQSQILITLYGDWNNAETGTFNVHGEVSLQRISAAAEPTWNTLRPKDSVEQILLQQQDFNTTWVNNGGLQTTQDQTDVFGNANTAWTLEDDDAAAFESVTQTASGHTSGDPLVCGVFILKQSSVGAYPAFRNNISGTLYDLQCDPILGAVYSTSSGGNPDRYGCIDGAVIKDLVPAYSNADKYWLFYAGYDSLADTSPTMQIWPAFSATASGGEANSNTGSNVFDAPFMISGASHAYLFDSIATSATVTEEIQDWSKIFTFQTEGSNNVANMVFTHGHHQLLGAENVTGLTNLSGDPLYPSVASSAQWSIAANSFTSQNDAVSVFPGQKSAQYVSNGTNAYIRDVLTAISSGKETVCCIVEINGGGKCIVRLRDVTVSQVYAGCGYVNSTRSATAQGSSSGAGAIQLGKGPNGGDLVFLWGTGTSANPGNNRNLEVYPNGQGPAVGQDNIIHYAGAFESDIVSILPFDGTRTAHSRWEYDIANLSDDEGTLQTDLIFTLDRADAGNADDEIVGQSGNVALLRVNGSYNLNSYDGTHGSGTLSTVVMNAQDATRICMAFSDTTDLNDYAIDGNNDLGTEAQVGGTFGSFSELTEIDVYPDGNAESFMPSLTISKKYSDATERASAVEYHRDD